MKSESVRAFNRKLKWQIILKLRFEGLPVRSHSFGMWANLQIDHVWTDKLRIQKRWIYN